MYEEIKNKIEKYDTIIIHGHERPDGDCLGSQIGLKEIIKANWPNKSVYIVGENSLYLSFLGLVDEVEDDKFDGALSIIVDLANKDRASDKRFNLSKDSLRIDHHIKVEEFASHEHIESDCSSCAEIIANMAFNLNLEVPLSAAIPLYTGMVTDTGRFKFDSITERTFKVAGKLISIGVKPQEIDNNLAVDSEESLRMKGYVLSNFKLVDKKFAYVKITQDEILKYNVSEEDAANTVNLMSTIKGIKTWALFIEYSDGKIKIRIRSKGPIINILAEKYNGGGHQMASGATIKSWDEMEVFISDMMECINNSEN